jgi:hypothetical protein
MRETRRSRLRLASSLLDGPLGSLRVLVSLQEHPKINDYYLTNVPEFFLDSQAPVYDLAFRMLSMSSSATLCLKRPLTPGNSGLLCLDDHYSSFTVLVVQA